MSNVAVDGLGAGQIHDGWGSTDTITSDSGVESIIGSQHGDMFYGSMQKSILTGGFTINGGNTNTASDLNDTVSYQMAD